MVNSMCISRSGGGVESRHVAVRPSSICDHFAAMRGIRKGPQTGSRLKAREPDGTREYAGDQGETQAGLAPGPLLRNVHVGKRKGLGQ
jgi:hypothetical protein